MKEASLRGTPRFEVDDMEDRLVSCVGDHGDEGRTGDAGQVAGPPVGIDSSDDVALGCKRNEFCVGSRVSDNDTVPDEVHGTSEVNSYELKSLSADDKSISYWVDSPLVDRFFSFDPNFELGGLSGWKSKNASITTTNVRGGTNSALVAADGWVQMTTTYDPWHAGGGQPENAVPYDGMVASPKPDMKTWYRESGDKGGGVRLRYRYRFLDYDTTADKTTGVVMAWSISITTIDTCNFSDFEWLQCVEEIPAIPLVPDDIVPPNPPTNFVNNAVILRATFKSMTPNALRLDETGWSGWH